MKNTSGNFQKLETMKFRISGFDDNSIRLAHYRAMFMNPEDVSGFNHENSSFIVDSNLEFSGLQSPNPFLKWCESLGEVKVELIKA